MFNGNSLDCCQGGRSNRERNPMSEIVVGNRRISQRALLLAMAALALAACTLGMASSARAGEWVQRSCSFGGTEYIAPEDWEAEANYGYVGLPPDNCERYYN